MKTKGASKLEIIKGYIISYGLCTIFIRYYFTSFLDCSHKGTKILLARKNVSIISHREYGCRLRCLGGSREFYRQSSHSRKNGQKSPRRMGSNNSLNLIYPSSSQPFISKIENENVMMIVVFDSSLHICLLDSQSDWQ